MIVYTIIDNQCSVHVSSIYEVFILFLFSCLFLTNGVRAICQQDQDVCYAIGHVDLSNDYRTIAVSGANTL